MKNIDELYVNYLRWCMKIDCPPLSPTAYEKALQQIPSTPNNVDAILRNNNQKKDRYDDSGSTKKR